MTALVKRTVKGLMVKLLFHQRENRGMQLIEHATRCIRQHEIVELVVSDQSNLIYPACVDRVGFLGFAEITQGGVIEAGDQLMLHQTCVGIVKGFDECHYPNHYNIIIAAQRCLTAKDINLQVLDAVHFLPARG